MEKAVKGEGERAEQMEWAGSVVVHGGMISMWLQYGTADTVCIYISDWLNDWDGVSFRNKRPVTPVEVSHQHHLVPGPGLGLLEYFLRDLSLVSAHQNQLPCDQLYLLPRQPAATSSCVEHLVFTEVQVESGCELAAARHRDTSAWKSTHLNTLGG